MARVEIASIETASIETASVGTSQAREKNETYWNKWA
jgi:hypothetical protein